MYEVYNLDDLNQLEKDWDIKKEWILNKKAYTIKKKLLSDPNYCWFVQKRSGLDFFKTVFPVRHNEIESSNDVEYINIINTEYKPSVKKILCAISICFYNGTQLNKTYKVSESAYLERTKNIRQELLKKIKADIDKTYGYYAVYKNNDNFYITDCNKDKNGYKKIFEMKDGVIIENLGKFSAKDILINFIKGEVLCGESGL